MPIRPTTKMSWKRCWSNNNSNTFYYDANDDQIVPDVDRHRHLHQSSKLSSVAPSSANGASATSTAARLSVSDKANAAAADTTSTRSRQGAKRSISPASAASPAQWSRNSPLGYPETSYRLINTALSTSSIFKSNFDNFYGPKFATCTSELDANNFWEERYAKITVLPAAPGQH